MDARDRILERIRRVPPGFVTTYGDVSPGAPRYTGQALRGARDVPWWRVVRADGTLAKGDRQRALLDAEDVPFVPGTERVDIREARIPPEAIG